MEVTDVTTDSSFTYNATTSVPGDSTAIWLPLVIVIVGAVLILGLIVVIRSIFCKEKSPEQLEQSINGSYEIFSIHLSSFNLRRNHYQINLPLVYVDIKAANW